MVKKLNVMYLQPVLQEKVFWCSDGKIIGSIEELHIALQDMSEETYRHHANTEKNDFSKWVREVIGDETLSKKLEKVLLQEEAIAIVGSRLKGLKSKKK